MAERSEKAGGKTDLYWTEPQWAAIRARAAKIPGMSPGRYVKWLVLRELEGAPSAPEEESESPAVERGAAVPSAGLVAGGNRTVGHGSARRSSEAVPVPAVPASPRVSEAPARDAPSGDAAEGVTPSPDAARQRPVGGGGPVEPAAPIAPGPIARALQAGAQPTPESMSDMITAAFGVAPAQAQPLWVKVLRVLERRGESGPKVANKARMLCERGKVSVDGVPVSDPEAEIEAGKMVVVA